ncbi:MAG: SIR2 family protein [Candidatus Omnitrophica bacterium]|nr:SIR2 family protein [Candidatus Omnitrophota bacterium]
MAIIVLGAGATRGVRFVENNICKPPLNDDFFSQLQHINNEKHFKTIEQAIKDAISLYGKNFKVTMEEFFTQIEFFVKVLPYAKERHGLTRADFNKIKDNFIKSISAVFEESITQKTCEYHTEIVKALVKDSTIVSFNYDCLIDYALKEAGAQKWNARYGYSFPLRKYRLIGDPFWSSSLLHPLATRGETIKLLKLHGSLNWHILNKGKGNKGSIRLKQHLYQNVGTPQFTIMPPEWNKELLKEPAFEEIWKEAARRIRREKIFVFIGFSFVPTDLFAASLFQLSIGKEKIKKLIIVNPDREARRRTRAVLNRGISDKTLIVQFDTFKDFSRAELKTLFSEKRDIGKFEKIEESKAPFGTDSKTVTNKDTLNSPEADKEKSS